MLLQPATPLHHEFQPAAELEIEIDLPPRSVGQIEVQQEGVDIALRLLDSAGGTEVEIDSPTSTSGTETLTLINDEAQTTRRRLRLKAASTSSGSCTTRFTFDSPVTQIHRQQEEAERAYAKGRELLSSSGVAAATEFGRAAELWRQLGRQDWQGYCLQRQGEGLLTAEQWQAAEAPLLAALEIFQHLDWPVWQATVTNQLGNIQRARGELDSAMGYFEQALALSARLQNEAGISAARQNLGMLHELYGDQEKALRSYLEALDRAKNLPARHELAARFRVNAANVYLTLQFPLDALAILEPIDDLSRLEFDLQIAVLLVRARAEAQLGNLRSAAELQRRSLKLAEQREKTPARLQALNNLGQLHRSLGGYAQSTAYLQQAVELAESKAFPPGIASSKTNLARTLAMAGDLTGSIRLFEQALALADKLQIEQTRASCYFGLAWVLQRQDRLEQALEHIDQAIEISDQLRRQQPSRGLQGEWQATKHHYLELQVELLAALSSSRQHEPAADEFRLEAEAVRIASSTERDFAFEAWQASDRSKARVLLDRLHESRVDLYGDMPPEMLARLHSLEEEIETAQKNRLLLLRSGVPKETLKQQEDLLADLQLRHQLLDADIRTQSRRYSSLTQPTDLQLADLRRLLGADTAVLSYQLGATQSHLWYIDQNRFDSFLLPDRETLESKVAALNRAWREGFTQAAELEDEVSQLLLGPLAEIESKPRLVVSGDGPLHTLPFAALRTPDGSRSFLIQRHEIVQLPSLMFLHALREARSDRTLPTQELFVLADAIFSTDDPRHGAPPAVSPAISSPANVRLRAALEDSERLELTRLPGTLKEARTILHLLGDRATTSAFGFEASRETLDRIDLGNFRVLHFATHGLIDNQRPEFSGLVLSLWNAAGEPQDGLLYVQQITRLHLNADLVVLSACKTGQGRVLRGEGVQSLAQAFFVAGTQRLVASLWKVDDNATADLMTLFYSAMYQHGQAPSQALQTAQKELIRRGAPLAHWAAFVHFGDWRTTDD